MKVHSVKCCNRIFIFQFAYYFNHILEPCNHRGSKYSIDFGFLGRWEAPSPNSCFSSLPHHSSSCSQRNSRVLPKILSRSTLWAGEFLILLIWARRERNGEKQKWRNNEGNDHMESLHVSKKVQSGLFWLSAMVCSPVCAIWQREGVWGLGSVCRQSEGCWWSRVLQISVRKQ